MFSRTNQRNIPQTILIMNTFSLKKAAVCLFAGLYCHGASAQHSWQKLTMPKAAAVAASFATPPVEYAHTLTYGLEGPLSREAFAADLDAMQKQGIQVVTMEGGYKMKEPYLSEGYFKNIQVLVEELKKRNMRLWIIDEGKYPSGFAGGKFSQERPDLRMQGLVAGRINVKEGETVTRKLDPSFISAIAVNQQARTTQPVDISSGELNFTAKQGNWQLMLVQHRFKTAVTRAANNPTGGKDTVNSLCDYLNPEATRQFLEFTHVQYKKYIGQEFGKTVLGFRGDEPEFGFTPWTPGIDELFKKKKGYDVRPYLASFFTNLADEKQKLAKADYWDVWSDLFRDNFFKIQADWCAANGLEYMVHVDHEDKMMDLGRTEGDYFRDMRYVQVPGVDAIWNQIWPGKVADFSKIASSAAHMFGRPRALSETFAAYNPKPTIEEARWVINQQLVRGINLFEFMFWPSSATGRPAGAGGYLGDPEFPAVEAYSHRAAWLLANGRPAAKIGLYCPTESMWLGQESADKSSLAIAQQLLEKQLDFDFVDGQGVGSVFKLEKGGFTNLSGQTYEAVIIPSADILPAEVFNRLQAFAKSGGKVIFIGPAPTRISGTTYLEAKATPDLSWATVVSSDGITPEVAKQLGAPDVQLSEAAPAIKYLHRKWQDAELYFFFNEGTDAKSLTATLAGTGNAEIWDAQTGKITPVAGKTEGKNTSIPLELGKYETRFVVIRSK
jgi:hypothetical protein